MPPCVNTSTTTMSNTKIGQWSEWSQWEQCSSQCGGGVQLRRRRCDLDISKYKHGGEYGCNGCDVEWRLCNQHDCQEVKQQSEWTEWLIKNITSDGIVEERVRFICRAQVGESASLSVHSRIEERFTSSPSVWSMCEYDHCNGWQFKWNGTDFMR